MLIPRDPAVSWAKGKVMGEPGASVVPEMMSSAAGVAVIAALLREMTAGERMLLLGGVACETWMLDSVDTVDVLPSMIATSTGFEASLDGG